MENRRFDGLAVVAGAMLVAVVILTFRDYGISWDEHVQAAYGERIIRFFQSGFEDLSAIDFRNLYLYGGLFEAIAQSLTKISPFSIFDTRHLFTALTGLAAYAGAWRLARHLGGPLAGILTVLFLIALPSFYGHIFMNPKDIPFAAGYIWTLYFTVRAAHSLPQIPFIRAFPLGLALGLTLGVRVGGVLLIGYMGLLVLLHYVWKKGRIDILGGDRQSTGAVIWNKVATALTVLVPAYVLMIALWPWALFFPIYGPYRSLMETVRFKWDSAVLFKGAYVPSLNLPRDYLPVYFGVKLPEFLLVILAIALPMAAFGLWRGLKEGNRRQVFGYTAIGLGVFFAPFYSIATKAVHYDAIRHFLFVLPPLAVLAGIETERAGVWLLARHRGAAAVVATLLAVGIIYTGWQMVRLHPYQYTYYNAFIGGMPGAAGKYELDYWATSYREVARELTRYANADAEARGIPPDKRSFRVKICGPIGPAVQFLPVMFGLERDLNQADFYISFTRWSCDKSIKAAVAVEVKRLNTRLAVALDLRKGFQVDPSVRVIK